MNWGIRTSAKPGSDKLRVPGGAKRQMSHGDKIQVRMVNTQCWRTVAEFELHNVADMSDVFGELRYRTRGLRGLMRLYVRNATRGWSFEQPFKLYGQSTPTPGVAKAANQDLPATQPASLPFDRGWRF